MGPEELPNFSEHRPFQDESRNVDVKHHVFGLQTEVPFRLAFLQMVLGCSPRNAFRDI